MRVDKAFILAGGEGTRMRPLTYDIPKALIPIHGKPMIQYQMELVQTVGVGEVILSIGYLGGQVREAFGDGSGFGIDITYVEEDTPLGTAGPLRLARDKLCGGPFFMFNGDVLTDINLEEFTGFHESQGRAATIALTPVEDVSNYGVVRMDGDRITEFLEKTSQVKDSNLINAGIYLLEPEVIDIVPEGKSMIETDVFPILASQGNLAGYSGDYRWYDSGTVEKYQSAENIEWIRK